MFYFRQYRIAKDHCDDMSVYKNHDLVRGLDTFFCNELLCGTLEHANGKVFSSIGVKNFCTELLPGMDKLLGWHRDKALSVSHFFGHPDAVDICIINSWVNKCFQNGSGSVHIHEPFGHVVSAFYAMVPNCDSADLVVVDGGLDHDTLESFSQENVMYQNVKEGDCVFMDIHTPHAVTKHGNRDARIGFVFEFKYVKD